MQYISKNTGLQNELWGFSSLFLTEIQQIEVRTFCPKVRKNFLESPLSLLLLYQFKDNLSRKKFIAGNNFFRPAASTPLFILLLDARMCAGYGESDYFDFDAVLMLESQYLAIFADHSVVVLLSGNKLLDSIYHIIPGQRAIAVCDSPYFCSNLMLK